MSQQNYWDQAQAGAQEEGGPGKPVIGRGRVDLGYWAYVSGFAGDDRQKCAFLPRPGKDGRDKARVAAQKFCQENGKTNDDARWCIITTIYEDEAMYADGSEIETWNNDQIDPIPLWTVWDKQGKRKPEPSAGGTVYDAVTVLKIKGGKDFYGKFGWVADPYKVSQGDAGKTKESQADDGTVTMRYPTVVVVQEVFANKADAANALGTPDAAASGDYSWAEGWDKDQLQDTLNDLTSEKDEYASFAELVEGEAGENETWGIKLLAEIGEMDVEDIAKFTGLKKGKIRKALKA